MARARKPQTDGTPDLSELRICIENKSVITAHRNKDARYDDLNESLQVLYKAKPETILVATVMIGTCQLVLNVPDRIKPFYKSRMIEWETKILPRLSSGDVSLLTEFEWAVSKNRAQDPFKTRDKFRQLETRAIGHTHNEGYDYILLCPVSIDNIHTPRLERDNELGINIDREYDEMINHICIAYKTRWYL